MIDVLLYIGVIAAACGGASVVSYISYKKAQGGPLVCPVGSDCNAVVNSEYAKFFGIPLELFGILYYSLIILGYSFSFFAPQYALGTILFPLTLGAFLFSLYLTFIQAFTLKQWCTWCLSSAGLSTTIFLLSTYLTDFGLIITFLTQVKPFIVAFHLLGFALGLGGATISDIFFFKFLKDLRISEREATTLRTISQVVWFGLGLLVVSGIGLILTDPVAYFSSTKFLAKMFIVFVITVNGAFLNLYITPLLVSISFGDKHKHIPGELHHERGLAYAGGAISMVSWYLAFTLGLIKWLPYSFWSLVVAYFVLLISAVAASQIVEHFIAQRGYTKPEDTPLH